VKVGPQPGKWIAKKAKAGFRGYPIGTLAFYGPDDRRASKVVAGIIARQDAEPDLRKWFADDADVRALDRISDEIVAFLREHNVRTVSMVANIIGCPHEEGIDFAEGEACPHCSFWANRDRWRGVAR
jgi:hypothetical protein